MATIQFRANLEDADIRQAKLQKMDLRGTCFSRAHLLSCDFTGADIKYAMCAETRFPDCVFDDADLRGAYLAGADLSGARLVNANLCGANLKGAKLTEAVLTGATYDKQTRWDDDIDPDALGLKQSPKGMEGAEVPMNEIRQPIDFSGRSFFLFKCYKAYLAEADFSGCQIQICDLRGANLDGARFTQAQVLSGSFQAASLIEAHLDGGNFSHASFLRADLTSASLVGADLRRAAFGQTNMNGTDIRGADFERSQQDGATFMGAVYDTNTRFAKQFDIEWSGARLADGEE